MNDQYNEYNESQKIIENYFDRIIERSYKQPTSDDESRMEKYYDLLDFLNKRVDDLTYEIRNNAELPNIPYEKKDEFQNAVQEYYNEQRIGYKYFTTKKYLESEILKLKEAEFNMNICRVNVVNDPNLSTSIRTGILDKVDDWMRVMKKVIKDKENNIVERDEKENIRQQRIGKNQNIFFNDEYSDDVLTQLIDDTHEKYLQKCKELDANYNPGDKQEPCGVYSVPMYKTKTMQDVNQNNNFKNKVLNLDKNPQKIKQM